MTYFSAQQAGCGQRITGWGKPHPYNIMERLIFTQALEPAFCIYSSTTAVTSSRDCLAIAMVSDITCGKNAWNIRHRVFNRNNIPDLIHISDALEYSGVRLMPDCQEKTMYRQRAL